MYIQITTRCNMNCSRCEHAYSKGGNREDMDLETFEKALDLATRRDEWITIGGGEPTLHSRFWDFVEIALNRPPWGAKAGFQPGARVGIVTNGSNAEDAIELARLGRQRKVKAALSLDNYHDRINPSVIAAFIDGKRDENLLPDEDDYRAVRVMIPDHAEIGICPCPCLFVEPSGEVKGCGCPDAVNYGPVGQVDDLVVDIEKGCSIGERNLRDWTDAEVLIRRKTIARAQAVEYYYSAFKSVGNVSL